MHWSQRSFVLDNELSRSESCGRNGLTVRALYGDNMNLLEVGHVIDQCNRLLQALPAVSVNHIRKQANKVAHSLARIPCLLNCFIAFSFPPTHVVETLSSNLVR